VLYQLDGATGEILQEMPGYMPTVVGDTLWYERDDEIVEADAATGAERAVYTPPKLGGTTVHDGVLWAADHEAGTLTAVDLAANEVLSEMDLPDGEPKWVEAWEGAIWVVIDGSDVVMRIDPHTGKVLSTTDAGRRPHSVAVGFGSLWVTEHGDTELLRFAPDGQLQAAIRRPGINVAIAVAGDSLWAASFNGLMEIDPDTNEVVREIELGSGDFYAMAVSQGSLWLTTAGRGKVFRIPLP
jgi:outer membrane protein assembly factor BamB